MSDRWKVRASEKGARWWVCDELGAMLFSCSKRWADLIVDEHNQLQQLLEENSPGFLDGRISADIKTSAAGEKSC